MTEQANIAKNGVGLKTTQQHYACSSCGNSITDVNLGEHFRKTHSPDEFKKAVLKAKENGTPDPEIGSMFNITFKQLEGIITDAYGINVSLLTKPKEIKSWAPKNFAEETTTVWSFKQRGNWAFHDGRYRGNWSPYIPRNVILKYSKPGDVVLDYFVGGGTTAAEAKLLGRQCIARDINPAAIGLTKENIKFNPPKTLLEAQQHEPRVSVGDARELKDIDDESVDLICSHPPYAGIINYSSQVEGDLSKLTVNEFLNEMKRVARESYRVLKPGSKCAILVGDTRSKKRVIPIGFQTINVFLEAGFKLKELVIKRQHNCKTTGFWYEKSVKYNFLLLAHEYLPIFEKADQISYPQEERYHAESARLSPLQEPVAKTLNDKLESTTVWIFPEKQLQEYVNHNLRGRYSDGNNIEVISLSYDSENEDYKKGNSLQNVVKQKYSDIRTGGFLVIQTADVRRSGFIEPLGQRIVDQFTLDGLKLKEIVMVTPRNQNDEQRIAEKRGALAITHQYLLIYEKSESN